MEPALVARCADPSLKPAVVERFLASAGAPDPLAVTVTSEGRLVVLPKPTNPAEAVSLVRRYVGHAAVRVGLTQMPAGLGARQVEDIDPELFDDCTNVRRGSALFARVMRIVAAWYGNPHGEEASRVIFEDAVLSWKSGFFEGTRVFDAEASADEPLSKGAEPEEGSGSQEQRISPSLEEGGNREGDNRGSDIREAPMRIDLTRLDSKR